MKFLTSSPSKRCLRASSAKFPYILYSSKFFLITKSLSEVRNPSETAFGRRNDTLSQYLSITTFSWISSNSLPQLVLQPFLSVNSLVTPLPSAEAMQFGGKFNSCSWKYKTSLEFSSLRQMHKKTKRVPEILLFRLSPRLLAIVLSGGE